MEIEDLYKMKNFETYCIATIEMDKMQRLAFGPIAENKIKHALELIRQKIEGEIMEEATPELRNGKRTILNKHLERYGTQLREQ